MQLYCFIVCLKQMLFILVSTVNVVVSNMMPIKLTGKVSDDAQFMRLEFKCNVLIHRHAFVDSCIPKH